MYMHHIGLTELEDMLPWERDVYISLLDAHLEEIKNKKNNNGA